MQLGFESRKKAIAAGALGVVLVLVLIHEVMQFSSSTEASVPVGAAATGLEPAAGSTKSAHAPAHKGTAAGKKERVPQSLDPTLNLKQLAATEQIKYEGSGRNIFVMQAEAEIPKPLAPGQTDPKVAAQNFQPPPPPPPAPIPLKFFGFANQAGEAKKVFLSKDDDVFIAGEGEIVDRRYKVVRISPTSVEIQDVVGSGPPQSIPLSQG